MLPQTDAIIKQLTRQTETRGTDIGRMGEELARYQRNVKEQAEMLKSFRNRWAKAREKGPLYYLEEDKC